MLTDITLTHYFESVTSRFVGVGSNKKKKSHRPQQEAPAMKSSIASRPPAYAEPIERILDSPDRLLFFLSNLSETLSMVGRIFRLYDSNITGTERLNARMHYIPLGDMLLSRLRYGATVEFAPCTLGSFFFVQMALWGGAVIEGGGQHINSHPEPAPVLGSDDETGISRKVGNDQIICDCRGYWSSELSSDILAIHWINSYALSSVFTGVIVLLCAACSPT